MADKDFTQGLDTPREILRSIYHQYGESILEDPRQFQALFKDLSKGQFIREMNLIKQSYSENIPSDLYKKRDQIPFQMLGPQLVKHLHESLGMEKGLAEWVVDSWAIAFDIIQEKTKTPEKQSPNPAKKPTPPKPTSQPNNGSAIFFTSNPPGGTVYLGKMKLGITPITVTISNAKHNFKCRLDGYEDDRKSLSITQDSTVNFNLKRRTESIFIATRPSGAAISLDGQHAGYSPLTIPDISHGSHHLICSMADYLTVDKYINVPPDVKFDFFLDLAPRLTITSSPPGAAILIDGNYKGITPYSITFISDGNYKIETNLKGYENQTNTIRLPNTSTIHFDLVKQSDPSQKKYPLSITTTPSGADIFLDRQQIGKSPQKIFLLNGFYNLRCSLVGYDDFVQQVKIPYDTDVNFTLTNNASYQKNDLTPVQRIDFLSEQDPIIPALYLATSPKNAKVFLDGIYHGVSPLSIPNLPEGKYNLKCSLDGFEDLNRSITIPTDLYLNLRLTKLGKPHPTHASLFVTSNPSGAEIYLDGKNVGTTPYDIPQVPVGSHNLLLYLAGYDPAKRIVEVPRDRNISSNLKQKIPFGGSNPIQNPAQNSPAAPSQKISVKNNGLFYWLLFSFGLLVAGLIFLGLFSGTFSAPTSVSAVGDNSVVAAIPPVVNQTDTMSLQSGISLLNDGNYAEALKEFESVIASNPQSAAAWNYKSFSLFKLGRYNESIQASDKTIALDQNYTAAWTTKGYNLNLLERYNEAIPAFDHAISLNSNNADPWIGKGISYFSLHNYSAAVVSFDRAITIAPTDKNAWNYKGKSLQALNNYSDAVAAYDSSLKNNPGDVQIILNKGDCLNALKDYQNASSVFNSVLTNDPKNKRALTGVGTAFLNQGKYQDALTKFEEVLSTDPNNVDALVGKCEALLNLKNSYDSLQIANKALEIAPQNSGALICKADNWAAQSKYSDAAQAYDQALKSNPNSLEALMKKANVLVKMEDYANAITILDNALAISPDNKELLNEKGYALIKKGDNSNAVITLNKAIEMDPKFVLAWSNKGYALSGTGNYNQSIQAFDKAIELNSNFKDAWIGKSIVYTKMGDFKASEAAAQQAMQIKQ